MYHEDAIKIKFDMVTHLSNIRSTAIVNFNRNLFYKTSKSSASTNLIEIALSNKSSPSIVSMADFVKVPLRIKPLCSKERQINFRFLQYRWKLELELFL